MKTSIYTYKGFHQNMYRFTDANRNLIVFGKMRKELIKEFDMMSTKSVNQVFSVRYFEVVRGDKSELIISDLSRCE